MATLAETAQKQRCEPTLKAAGSVLRIIYLCERDPQRELEDLRERFHGHAIDWYEFSGSAIFKHLAPGHPMRASVGILP